MYDHVRKPSRRRDGMLLVWILTAVFLLIALAAALAIGLLFFAGGKLFSEWRRRMNI